MTESSTSRLNAQVQQALSAEPTPLVYVVGAGPVGTALAGRLTRMGVPVAGVHGRDQAVADEAAAASGALAVSGALHELFDTSDIVIISVRDGRVRETARMLIDSKRLRKTQIVLHTSGSHPAAEILGDLRKHVRAVGTLHPLISFTRDPGAHALLDGAAFAVEGDAEAREEAHKLVRFLGGQALELDGKRLPLYHAGAVLASNDVVALVDLARGLLVSAGVDEAHAVSALVPLLKSVAANLASAGLPDALTGPVVRGDVATVEAHLGALDAGHADVAALYRRLGQETLRLARAKNPGLRDSDVTNLKSLFGGAAPAKAKNGVATSVASTTAGAGVAVSSNASGVTNKKRR